MTDEYMTLSEALATGLPFKHKDWNRHISCADILFESCQFPPKDFWEPVWQVQRPKTNKRIWIGGGQIMIADRPPESWKNCYDATELIKEVLKD